MRILGILSLVAMALTGVVVAIRLIALARRSGKQPEQLMGVGLAATHHGIGLFAAFTCRVFRSDSPWATALVVAIAGALGVEWLGLVSASAMGRTMEEILPHTRPWAIAGFAIVALCTVIAACMLAGLAPLRHGLPLSAIGAAAVVASTCWTLAFLPPASYLAALRRRHPAAS